jgi:predicted DCC family thiol-disulfide oxidoreductase YuxK
MKTVITQTKPPRDTVLYDGRCRFCRSQIAILRRLDLGMVLEFTSLHDPSVGSDFPELAHDDLLAQMVVVDTAGRARGGAEAVRYLSRRLPLLWPLAVPLHIPGTLPLWAALYRFVARNRMRIAGSCEDGTCKLPQ